jgi:hypothetical protein
MGARCLQNMRSGTRREILPSGSVPYTVYRFQIMVEDGTIEEETCFFSLSRPTRPSLPLHRASLGCVVLRTGPSNTYSLCTAFHYRIATILCHEMESNHLRSSSLSCETESLPGFTALCFIPFFYI